MEAETQDQQQPVYPIPPQFSNHASEGALRQYLEVEDIIAELQISFKCQIPEINPATNKIEWVTPEGIKPIINQAGLNRVFTHLRSRLTKIYSLSDLDEDVIDTIAKTVGSTLIEDLHNNWDQYEIADSAAASLIVQTVSDAAYATMRKAKQAKFLKFLSTTGQFHEVQNIAPERNQQGVGDKIMDFLSRRKR